MRMRMWPEYRRRVPPTQLDRSDGFRRRLQPLLTMFSLCETVYRPWTSLSKRQSTPNSNFLSVHRVSPVSDWETSSHRILSHILSVRRAGLSHRSANSQIGKRPPIYRLMRHDDALRNNSDDIHPK